MDSSVSNLCWHGFKEVGSMAHSLLFCPAVKALWETVRLTLSQILNTDIKLSAAMCLLGLHPTGINSSSAQKIMSLACFSAKRLILMNW